MRRDNKNAKLIPQKLLADCRLRSALTAEYSWTARGQRLFRPAGSVTGHCDSRRSTRTSQVGSVPFDQAQELVNGRIRIMPKLAPESDIRRWKPDGRHCHQLIEYPLLGFYDRIHQVR